MSLEAQSRRRAVQTQVAGAGTQRLQPEEAGNEVCWWRCVPGGLGRLQGARRHCGTQEWTHSVGSLREGLKDTGLTEAGGGCQWPALLSLPHYPSEAGVWVLLGRVGPSLS